MKTHKPTNLEELLNIKSSIRFDGWSPYLVFFRGQISDWEIKPNITRNPELSREEILHIEKDFFNIYKEETLGLKVLEHFDSQYYKHAQDWQNLFQAQHLGFYTRLTDWTQDFESALFFAIDDENNASSDVEGVVWIYKCPNETEFLINFNNPENDIFLDKHPFDLEKFYVIKHPTQFPDNFLEYAGEMRRFRQNGSFIISTSQDILKPVEQIDYILPHLEKIIISPALKIVIKEYLNPTLKEYFYFSSEENNSENLTKIKEITKKSNDRLFWKKYN